MTRKDGPLSRSRAALALVTIGVMAAVTAPAAQSSTQRSSQAAAVTAILVDVVVPMKLTKKQRELLEAYAAEGGEAVHGPGGFFDKVRDALG